VQAIITVYHTETPIFRDGFYSYLFAGCYDDYWRYLMSTFRRFWDDDSGATSIEYSVIAAGVALAIVATVQILGVKVTSLFSTVLSGFN